MIDPHGPNRDDPARRERVRAVLAAARALADPGHALGREARAVLRRTSGLSPEGVELVLTEHLETDASEGDLAALLSSTGRAPRCGVVLSAHVPTAIVRALALATATAPLVRLRPSRRDPDLAPLALRALEADGRFAGAGGSLSVALSDEDRGRIARELAPGDELHVYGSDGTVSALEAVAPAGVRVRGHGTGFGIAIVAADDDLDSAASAIARDVIPFDQRGCLSPRLVLVDEAAGSGSPRTLAFALALSNALDAFGARVPRGPEDDASRAEVARYRATVEAIGRWHGGRHHGVGADPEPRALLLPPAARIVHVAATSPEGAGALLAPLARWLTTVGRRRDGALASAVLALAPGARSASLGAIQRPPLDGPVDRRGLVRAVISSTSP